MAARMNLEADDENWDSSPELDDSNSETDTDLKNIFEGACSRLEVIASTLDSDKLLYFYARYKQAIEGPCNIPKPNFFDFQGRQKWMAWKTLGDMNKEIAMSEYITAMKHADPEWNPEVDESSKHKTLAKALSTMPFLDDHINDEQKTTFDWVKENNIDKIKELITRKDFFINQKDEQHMTLLHWACDRGHISLVEVLLQNGIDINAQDEDGQTALHYDFYTPSPSNDVEQRLRRIETSLTQLMHTTEATMSILRMGLSDDQFRSAIRQGRATSELRKQINIEIQHEQRGQRQEPQKLPQGCIIVRDHNGQLVIVRDPDQNLHPQAQPALRQQAQPAFVPQAQPACGQQAQPVFVPWAQSIPAPQARISQLQPVQDSSTQALVHDIDTAAMSRAQLTAVAQSLKEQLGRIEQAQDSSV